MRTDVLIEMVSSMFSEMLCGGCEILRNDGEKEYTDVYGSCLGCREAAAAEIIKILREGK